ncbi:MAG: efflux RND transporter periplasmic adaptor subunit, partial [Vulcanimicrobiaceae bacterium]
DYNSKVKKGEVLARIDPTQLQAQLDQANATLVVTESQAQAQAANASGAQSGVAVARAGIQTAQSNVSKAQSAYTLAQATVSRDRALLVQGYLAQNIYDADASAAVAAQSALAAAQAALVQANASTSQSSAQAMGSQYTAQSQNAAIAVSRAQVAQVAYNLQHTIITSPVDGTVVARNVSVGQTVAASFQTPTLFTIAQNLQKMQVDIAVGESDIGNLRVGNGVDFTVLAYPSKVFHGVVSQVRVNPTTVSNVVTYDVVTLVDNPNLELLPGMTANATINVAIVRNELIVPTQALSWRPATAAPRKGSRTSSSTPKPSATGLTASPWGQTAPGVGVSALPGATGLLFVRNGSTMHAVRVRVDLISGTQAAVTPISGTLNVGDAVVISDSSQSGTRSTRPTTTGGPTTLGRPIH